MGPDLTIIKELSGFSGCKIYLIKDGAKKIFVRKISKSLDYNNRILKQKQKQEYFFNFLQNKKIKTPKIYAEGHINGLYYFDMEYVLGETLIKKTTRANLQELKKITRRLMEIIRIMSKKKLGEKVNIRTIMFKKLDEIKKNQVDNQNLIEKVKEKIHSEEVIENTFCHGDLTFENIIVEEKTGNYYLIDFLDSYMEHYWIDIAKLFQDIEGKWYLLRNSNIDINTMEIKMAIIAEIFFKNFLLDDKYIHHHHNLLAITFCRILPYAASDQKKWLIEKIKQSLKSNLSKNL